MFNRKKIKKLENHIEQLHFRFDRLLDILIIEKDKLEEHIEQLEKNEKIQMKINKTHNDILKSLNKKFPKYL